MGRLSLEVDKNKVPFETLRINRTKREINAVVSSFSFIDKDTKQHVVFIPSLQVSAYGSTKKKCNELLRITLDDCFNFLITLKERKKR